MPNLYSFRDKKTKQMSDFIEDIMFARLIERHTPFIINRILNGDTRLTDLENSILAIFTAFQYARTPYFLVQLETMLIYFIKEKLIPLEKIAEKDFFRKAFIENSLNVNREDIIQFALSNRERLEGADNLLIRLSVQIADYISGIIFHKKLNLLKIAEPDFLFVTDHPVVIFNAKYIYFLGPMLWELDRNSVIFLPISPAMGIYYTDYSLGDIEDLTSRFKIFWELSIKNRHIYIYADRKSTILNDLIQNDNLSPGNFFILADNGN